MKKRPSQKPLLVDRFGSPMASSGFYESADWTRSNDADFYYWMNGAKDTDQVLSPTDWTTLMTQARRLFTNAPLLRGAVIEQARYAFPLEPHYVGKDKAWGKLAKEFLYSWKKNSDVRGYPFDCHRASRIRLIGRIVDGDIARVFVREPDGSKMGAPRLQFIRAHRISDAHQEKDEHNKLKDGPWKGYRIKNGVVMNSYDRALALCIAGAKKADDQFIPESPAALRDMNGIVPFILSYNPDLCDQARGISEVSVCLASLKSHKRWRENEERAQEVQSALTIGENNATGENEDIDRASDNQIISSAGGTGLTRQVFEKGMIRFFRAESGAGLTLYKPDRPGPGVLAFDDRTIEEIIYGMGWEPNFAMLIKQPGGAWARTILRKVNGTLADHQCLEANAQHREDIFALSTAIENGDLPRPLDNDITSWDYQGPPKITADSGNEARAKQDGYKLGLITRRRIFAEEGLWREEEDAERLSETRDRLTDAASLVKEFPELTLPEAYQLLEQRTQQLTTTGPEEAAPPTPEDE